MKRVITITVVIVILILLTMSFPCMICLEASATTDEIEKYGIVSLSPDEAADIASNIEFTIVKSGPSKMNIDCFDVSNDESIAICFSRATQKTICVYSKDFTFLYGFSFYSSGSVGVSWINDELNLYFVRGDILATIDENAKITSISTFPSTTQSDKYYRHEILVTTRQIGDKQYSLNNPGILKVINSGYSQLIVQDSSEETHILYDTNITPASAMIGFCAVSSIIVTMIILVIVWTFRKLKKAKLS